MDDTQEKRGDWEKTDLHLPTVQNERETRNSVYHGTLDEFCYRRRIAYQQTPGALDNTRRCYDLPVIALILVYMCVIIIRSMKKF